MSLFPHPLPSLISLMVSVDANHHEKKKRSHSCRSCLAGNLDKVGQCVAQYWQMKKCMAPGCESQTIAQIMTALKPYMLGMCSAGAGGGGFIYGILRDGKMRSEAVEVLIRQTVSWIGLFGWLSV